MMGVLAEKLHITEAIGALLLGLILAETTHNHRIPDFNHTHAGPVRAVFFFPFGMAMITELFRM